jgi:transposase
MATATPTVLTDEQWKMLAPPLPPRKPRSRPRVGDRRTITGILGVLRTGAHWACALSVTPSRTGRVFPSPPSPCAGGEPFLRQR